MRVHALEGRPELSLGNGGQHLIITVTHIGIIECAFPNGRDRSFGRAVLKQAANRILPCDIALGGLSYGRGLPNPIPEINVCAPSTMKLRMPGVEFFGQRIRMRSESALIAEIVRRVLD
jgi:hypothetical protein